MDRMSTSAATCSPRSWSFAFAEQPARGTDTGKRPAGRCHLAITDAARSRLRSGPAPHRSPYDRGSSTSRVRRRLWSTATDSPGDSAHDRNSRLVLSIFWREFATFKTVCRSSQTNATFTRKQCPGGWPRQRHSLSWVQSTNLEVLMDPLAVADRTSAAVGSHG